MTKRCFVVQGFGTRQDYQQGKQFNLDASYAVIKEAIQDAGLECYRADELRTSGSIDQVMYEQLLTADLVVADISTLNFNAAYELGVRVALRPFATIIVGEQGMNFPFDVNHVYIHKYVHLGDDIGNKEAKRFRAELIRLAKEAIELQKDDSPVYQFLKQLPRHNPTPAAAAPDALESVSDGASLRDLKDQAETAMREGRFKDATKLWAQIWKLEGKNDNVVQKLALSTYKSEDPDAHQALVNAKSILEYLKPRASFDTETLGLWAAVHKRLFDMTNDTGALEEAIFALERGFFVKGDYYNGINLAYLLDVKASRADEDMKRELHGFARYVRRKVKPICQAALVNPELPSKEKYWVLATLYEASAGLAQPDEEKRWKQESESVASDDWMKRSTAAQVAKLKTLIGATIASQ